MRWMCPEAQSSAISPNFSVARGRRRHQGEGGFSLPLPGGAIQRRLAAKVPATPAMKSLLSLATQSSNAPPLLPPFSGDVAGVFVAPPAMPPNVGPFLDVATNELTVLSSDGQNSVSNEPRFETPSCCAECDSQSEQVSSPSNRSLRSIFSQMICSFAYKTHRFRAGLPDHIGPCHCNGRVAKALPAFRRKKNSFCHFLYGIWNVIRMCSEK